MSAFSTVQLEGEVIGREDFPNYRVATQPLHDTAEANDSGLCQLRLRLGQLLVRKARRMEDVHLISTRNKRFLSEWLQYSPARLVRIEPELGEFRLKMWADLCHQFDKAVFLRLPLHRDLPHHHSPIAWLVKRCLDWMAAAVLVTLFSPLLLLLAALIRIQSPGPIFFRQWRVGERGRLFRIYKFRTMVQNAEQQHHKVMVNQDQTGLHKRQDDPRITPLGRLMRKYSLDELPQLFNVLQGEMSLVGPRPWALYDAIRISSVGQKRLNALPGITGDWQVKARSTMLDLEAVNRGDLNYLSRWTLWQDLKILLMTVPKVLSGFGAC